MNEKNRNLVVRIVSAVLLLPIVLVLLWLGGWWTAVLLAGAGAVCASEYYLIVWKRLPPNAWVCMAAAAVMPLLPALTPRNPFAYPLCRNPPGRFTRESRGRAAGSSPGMTAAGPQRTVWGE